MFEERTTKLCIFIFYKHVTSFSLFFSGRFVFRVIFFLFPFFLLFFSCPLLPDHSVPSLLSPLLPLPVPFSYRSTLHFLCFPSIKTNKKKRAGLPGISTQLCITHYSKTSHKSSYQGGTRQSSRSKRVLKTDKGIRDTLLPLLGVPQENQATET